MVCFIDSSPCILRPPVKRDKCGLKLKVVLKSRDIYIENVRVVSVIRPVLKQRELLNGGVLNRRDHCTYVYILVVMTPTERCVVRNVVFALQG